MNNWRRCWYVLAYIFIALLLALFVWVYQNHLQILNGFFDKVLWIVFFVLSVLFVYNFFLWRLHIYYITDNHRKYLLSLFCFLVVFVAVFLFFTNLFLSSDGNIFIISGLNIYLLYLCCPLIVDNNPKNFNKQCFPLSEKDISVIKNLLNNKNYIGIIGEYNKRDLLLLKLISFFSKRTNKIFVCDCAKIQNGQDLLNNFINNMKLPEFILNYLTILSFFKSLPSPQIFKKCLEIDQDILKDFINLSLKAKSNKENIIVVVIKNLESCAYTQIHEILDTIQKIRANNIKIICSYCNKDLSLKLYENDEKFLTSIFSQPIDANNL